MPSSTIALGKVHNKMICYVCNQFFFKFLKKKMVNQVYVEIVWCIHIKML
jgi:hypothetical protein